MYSMNRYWLLPVFVLLLLAGCATPARVDQMIARPQKVTAGQGSFLKEKIGLGAVAGGEDTNPLWVSNVANADFARALEGSLRAADLLAPSREESQYFLAANLNALQQPLLGFDLTVTASVSYTLTDAKFGNEIFRTTVSTPFTATVSDAFLGVERLKIANEGAVKANLASIIERLHAFRPGGVIVIPMQSKESRLIELKSSYERGLITQEAYIEQQKKILNE